jgi:hypothetical protein
VSTLKFNLNPKKVIWALLLIIGFLVFALLIQGGDLKQAQRARLDQSNYCLKYTSDSIAYSQLTLLREQDAHKRDVDTANSQISDLVNRYNALLTKTRNKAEHLNLYGFLVKITAP